jgi:membrane associated rhomboid family serine protease
VQNLSNGSSANAAMSTSSALRVCAGLVAGMWVVYGLQWVIPGMSDWGLVPRTGGGLVGILSMHFLHGSLGHLLSNTVPLIALLLLLIASRRDALRLVFVISITSAALLWMVGRQNNHIGASVLVYGLSTFLLTAGIVEKRWLDMLVSVIVLILFGGSLLWGVIPTWSGHVSWDGHLSGAIAGIGLAFLNRRQPVSELADTR